MAGVSELENKQLVREWIVNLNPDRVLDIGAGVGTYAILAKHPNQHWTAIEVFAPYVEMFNLNGKYDQVVVGDARFIDYNKLRQVGQFYDLIIAADMLEHMPKQDAKDLLELLFTQGKYVLICFPVVHNDQHAGTEGNDFEAHIDHWDYDEMRDFLGGRMVKNVLGDICAYFLAKGAL